MTVLYNPPNINWGALSQMGQDVGGALGQRSLGNAMQGAIGPNGEYDYNKMIAVLASRRPELAAKLATNKMEADALAGYRRDSLVPPEVRLYDHMYPGRRGADGGPPAPGTVQVAQGGVAQGEGDPSLSEFLTNRKGGTPGEIARDKEFGKEVADWHAGGGFAGVNRQLEQLGEGVKNLEGSNSITGPIVGSLSDGINAFVNPEAINTREIIEESIQSSLRKVLGAQYTQLEGEALLRRTFNARLDEKTNAKRAQRVLNQLKTMASVKDDATKYFEQHGTLRGWNGKLATGQADIDIDTPAPGEEGAKSQGRLEASPVDAPAVNRVQTVPIDPSTGQPMQAGAAPETPALADELAKGGYEKQPRTPTPKEIQMLRTAIKKNPEQQQRIEEAFDRLLGKKDSADFYLRDSR
jgi:hypothetical protein